MSTPCHTRITNKHFQYFADGVHKFYLEYCCERPCLDGQNRCKACIKIHPGARSQFDSTYPHGHMSEPIPEHSHIFGGSWYQNRVQLWGEPSPEAIALAMQHQREARQYYTPVASKAKIASISQDMARKKVVEAAVEAVDVTVATVATAVPVAPVKKPRKPRVATATSATAAVEIPIVEQVAQVAQVEQVKPIKVPKPKKAAKTSPKVESVPVQETRICKEVVIPTHIEQQIEEIDTNDYEIEYVPLTFIDIEHTTYFRDAKNKLYQKIKEKIIGPYVGRYCPHTESICTEVPDSDEENDS